MAATGSNIISGSNWGTSSNTTMNVTWDSYTWDSTDSNLISGQMQQVERIVRGDARVRQGDEAEIALPDGSVLHVDGHGNFRVEDANARVTYRANRNRAFNPYVNAGDLLGRFLQYVQTIPGVRRDDLGTLPIQLFAHWLIIEAAERDGDPVPDDIQAPPESRLLRGQVRPQCELPTCRRFIPKATARKGFRYCNPRHADRHFRTLEAA